MMHLKLKAGALQFALLIGVLVALILSSFLMLTYVQQSLVKRINLGAHTRALCHEGISYALLNNLAYDLDITPDIAGADLGNITLRRMHWGIYDKVISQAKDQAGDYQKIALIGGQLPQYIRTAIHLEDTNTPLILMGNTSIHGNVLLSEKGIRAGNIAKKQYTGSELVKGKIGIGTPRLPPILPIKRQYLERLIFGGVPLLDSLFIQSDSKAMTLPFDGPPRWLYRKGAIILDGQYAGNLIIKSESNIYVSSNANLNNVIIIAPRIEIASGFSGSLQAMATEYIDVQENVQLDYPSTLILWEKTDNNLSKNQQFGITINEGSRVAGSLLFIGESQRRDLKPNISIKTNALVLGEIYNQGNTEVLGSVHGSVYTHTFVTELRGSVYQNHIYNGEINSFELPESFGGLQLNSTKKNIVAWVQ